MRTISLLLSLAAIMSSVVPAQGPHALFHSFDFPGARNTQATSMTLGGDIVGRYYNSDGSHHGFLLQNGTFSTIDFPGAVITDPEWISESRVIVGYYNDGSFNHGFQLIGGRFNTIDYPGFPDTIVAGIGLDGDMVGGASNSFGTEFHGFLLRHGNFSLIDFPSSSVTFQEATMIAAGRIVGGYLDAAGSHGYVLADGNFKSIDCPNAPGGVFLSAIDFFGRVAGQMATADGHSHGLVVSKGECIAVDYPDSTATYANSINAFGNVAGRYTDTGGQTHGFFAEHVLPALAPLGAGQ